LLFNTQLMVLNFWKIDWADAASTGITGQAGVKLASYAMFGKALTDGAFDLTAGEGFKSVVDKTKPLSHGIIDATSSLWFGYPSNEAGRIGNELIKDLIGPSKLKVQLQKEATQATLDFVENKVSDYLKNQTPITQKDE